jgi:hypothetical protein
MSLHAYLNRLRAPPRQASALANRPARKSPHPDHRRPDARRQPRGLRPQHEPGAVVDGRAHHPPCGWRRAERQRRARAVPRAGRQRGRVWARGRGDRRVDRLDEGARRSDWGHEARVSAAEGGRAETLWNAIEDSSSMRRVTGIGMLARWPDGGIGGRNRGDDYATVQTTWWMFSVCHNLLRQT